MCCHEKISSSFYVTFQLLVPPLWRRNVEIYIQFSDFVSKVKYKHGHLTSKATSLMKEHNTLN